MILLILSLLALVTAALVALSRAVVGDRPIHPPRSHPHERPALRRL